MAHNYLPLHPLDTFSERELVILELIAQRFSNQEIADRLYLSLDTVKWYNKRIFSKLGVNRRSQAAQRARELLLLPLEREVHPPDINLVNRWAKLPTSPTPFLGRDQELAGLRRLIEMRQARLVTILAPGGMGKSRLALQMAHLGQELFTSGAFFVPLASIASSEYVITAIAEHFGLRSASSDLPPKQQLLDFLSNKRLLIVLDGFEHVLEAAPLVSEMLQSADGVQIIVTSRERLNLSNETIFLLGGLAYPDNSSEMPLSVYPAVELFIDRARRVQPEFVPSDVESIIRVCQITGGLPLAIELAGAWANVLTPAEIVEQINDSLDFLQTDMQDIPPRLRSIRAIFEWMWVRLTPEEQIVFRRLSAFRGGCTWQALQAVTGAQLRTVTRLVNRAILWRSVESDRYEMHELLQQFAREQCETAGETEAITNAYCLYYMNLLSESRFDLEGRRQLEAVSDINQDRENIRAAWLKACDDGQDALIRGGLHGLWLYYYIRGLYADGIALLHQSVQHLDKHTELRGMILAREAYFCVRFSDHEEAHRLLSECQTLLHDSQPAETHALVAVTQGWLLCQSGRPTDAVPLFEHALALYRTINDRWGVGFALLALGRSYCMRNDVSESDIAYAQRYLQEAVTINRSKGDLLHLAHSYRELGFLAGSLRNHEEHARLQRLSFHYHQLLGNVEGMAGDLTNLSVIACAQGQFAEARQLQVESVKLYKELGDNAKIARALGNLAILAFDLGEFDQARQYAEEGLSLVEGSAHERWICVCLFQLTRIAWAQGLYSESAHHLQRLIDLERKVNRERDVGEDILYLANVLLTQGKLEDAKQQHEKARQIAQRLDHPLLQTLCQLEWGYIAYAEGHYADAKQALQVVLASVSSGTLHRFLDALGESMHLSARALTLLGIIETVEGDHATAWKHFREALTLPHLMQSPPRILSVLTAVAALLMQESRTSEGSELANFVYTQPKTYAADKADIHRLLMQCGSGFSASHSLSAARQQADLSVEAVVNGLLSLLGDKDSDTQSG